MAPPEPAYPFKKHLYTAIHFNRFTGNRFYNKTGNCLLQKK